MPIVLCLGIPAIFAFALPYAIRDVGETYSAARGSGVHGTLNATASDCSKSLRFGPSCDPVGVFLSDDGSIGFADAKLDLFHAGDIPAGTSYRVTWQGDSDHRVYNENSPVDFFVVIGFVVLGVLALLWCVFCGVELARQFARARRRSGWTKIA